MPRHISSAKAHPPSMYDVARAAGVSQTTVSFVINSTLGINISQATRERIWAVVKELNYRPNATARSLSTQRSYTIGFIADEMAIGTSVVTMLQGAQDAAWGSSRMLLVITTGGAPMREEAAVEILLERQVEGIIYASMEHRNVTPPPQLSQVPAVLLDCYADDHSLPSVVPDEVQGGSTATKILLKNGHRRIGFISNSDPTPVTTGHLEGYRQALAAHAVPFDANLVAARSRGEGDGYHTVQALMQQPDPPTALFCTNDILAMDAYAALQSLRLAIPNDVAVLGCDTQGLVAAHLFPPLSTLELPHLAMARRAVEYLVDDAARELLEPPVQERLAYRYVARLSV